MGNCATKPKVKKDPDDAPAPVPAPETPVNKGKAIAVEGDGGVENFEKRPSLSRLFKEDEVKGIENETKETESVKPVFTRQITFSDNPNLEPEVPEIEKSVEINGNRNGISESFKSKDPILGIGEVKFVEVSTEKIPEAISPKIRTDQNPQTQSIKIRTDRVPDAEIPEILGNETQIQSIKPEVSTEKPSEADISEIPAGLAIKKLKLENSIPESSEIKVPEASSDETHPDISEFETPKTPETLKTQTNSLPEISENKTLETAAEKNPEGAVFFDAEEKIEAGTPKNAETKAEIETTKVLLKNIEEINKQAKGKEAI